MDLSLNLRSMVAQQLLPRKDGKGRTPVVEVLLSLDTTPLSFADGDATVNKTPEELLRDVLSHQLRKSPELANDLAAQWSDAAENFDRIHVHGMAPRDGESLECLEARKMLYRLFSVVGTMPKSRS